MRRRYYNTSFQSIHASVSAIVSFVAIVINSRTTMRATSSKMRGSTLQSDDELLDTRHPQSNILCAGRTGEDIHVDGQRLVAVVGLHR